MTVSATQALDAFRSMRVVVIGDAMLDSYIEGDSGRLCREAPVPIVSVATRTDTPGGAANTAVNVRALGAVVTLLSVCGDDIEGALLRDALEARGLSADGVIVQSGRRTLAKHRVVADGQLLVRYDQGAAQPLDREAAHRLQSAFEEHLRDADAVVVSDYAYGALADGLVECIGREQARRPRVLVVDARDLRKYRECAITAVKPNYAEAVSLLGLRPPVGQADRAEFVTAHRRRLFRLTGAQNVAVTMDAEGAVFFERGQPAYRTYARPTGNSRAAGAGDTFTAAWALGLASGIDRTVAAELASAAAGVVVEKDGTSSCSRDELLAHLGGGGKAIASGEALRTRAALYRSEGKRIVFTNGCFDILHRGHVTYLSRAKALGDVLVVAVNSDDSIRRLKGADRPINSLDDRLQVLAALSCVDHVVAFDGDTPEDLIEAARPDLFVKGGDYTRERLPEAELVEQLGGRVHIMPFMEDRSTTGIINRIKTRGIGGAAPSLPGRRAH